MKEALREARYVVLVPVDTRQLVAFGCRVTSSVIPAGSLTEEKKELQGVQLRKGEEIAIDYLINGRPAKATYSIEDIQPPDSYVGKDTRVETQTNSQNAQSMSPFNQTDNRVSKVEKRSYFRSSIQERLRFLQEELRLAMEEGLPVSPLQVQIELLEKSLKTFF